MSRRGANSGANFRRAAQLNERSVRSALESGNDLSNAYDVSLQADAAVDKYLRVPDYDAATGLLEFAAGALLRAGKANAAGPLAERLVEVFKLGKVAPDSESKGRLLALLRHFPENEPRRKGFVDKMIIWSAQCGPYPAGDPELHHVAGSLYAQELKIPLAESHLLLGTKDSAETLAGLHYTWYKANEPHMAPEFCARSVLPYLAIENLRNATLAYQRFTALLETDNPNMGAQEAGIKGKCRLKVYPSLPLLNFLGLLLLTLQRGLKPTEDVSAVPAASVNQSLYTDLVKHYEQDVKQVGWNPILEGISYRYFRISPPRQVGNPFGAMLDMLTGGMDPAK